MYHPLAYDAELDYRRSSVRRAFAANKLAKQVKGRRPRRMDSVHNYRQS